MIKRGTRRKAGRGARQRAKIHVLGGEKRIDISGWFGGSKQTTAAGRGEGGEGRGDSSWGRGREGERSVPCHRFYAK